MKREVCLITGVAGFIGSNLADALVKKGYFVRGIDSFEKNYEEALKRNNIKHLLKKNNFSFSEENLLKVDLEEQLDGVEYIFHQAGQPGVRSSWGKEFKIYLENNVWATQKLLESVKGKRIKKMIFASSSSVYGNAERFPTTEKNLPYPISPYGVTKLAAEQLCLLYWKNYQVPVVALRYFTVYGPRQRPDLFFHKLIKAALCGGTIEIYGDGKQTRSYTYIDDVVDANILAMGMDVTGQVMNIGGGARVSVNEAIELVEKISGRSIKKSYVDPKKGDVKHTCASIKKARAMLGYYPKTRIKKGLLSQFEWMKKNISQI